MTLYDVLGVAGVVMILAAYAATILGKLDPKGLAALLANFVGASLILLSLWREFNLSASLMEGAWALMSLFGLGRLAFMRLRAGPPKSS